MGAGSSKVDWSKQKQPSAPVKVHRSHSKHGIDDSFYDAPVQPQITRSQSVKSPPASAATKERREKRSQHHRAYTETALGNVPHHWDPHYVSPDLVPVIPQQQPAPPPLRNPLPPPPKDLFAGATDFSRVHYASPPPFVPVSNVELKRSRTGKGKVKETALHAASLSQSGRDIILQRGEPSSSFSSHSSASTSNPPPQVITSPFGVQYSAMGQAQTMPVSAKSKSRRTGIFSSLKSSLTSPTRPDTNPVIPPRPSISSTDGRAISSPLMLAPRGPPAIIPPVYFYWPDAPGYGFTTFSPHKILYKKRLYPTAEHLYQAMKFLPSKSKGGDEGIAERIRTISQHPRDAVLEGRRYNKQARSDWKEMRTVWMDEIMYMKFIQHPDLRHELISTHPAELVFASSADDFWGVGPQNAGRNELGQSLVRVRARILREMGK